MSPRAKDGFYIGVRYENGTIISKPYTAASPYTTSASALLRAYLDNRLDMTIKGHETVVVLDEGGTIRGSKGNGRYVAPVVQAIKSAFFREGVSILHTDTSKASRPTATQPVPSAAAAPSPPPVPSFYDATCVYPKHKVVTT
jgi:hypothetical protein